MQHISNLCLINSLIHCAHWLNKCSPSFKSDCHSQVNTDFTSQHWCHEADKVLQNKTRFLEGQTGCCLIPTTNNWKSYHLLIFCNHLVNSSPNVGSSKFIRVHDCSEMLHISSKNLRQQLRQHMFLIVHRGYRQINVQQDVSQQTEYDTVTWYIVILHLDWHKLSEPCPSN